MIRKRGGGIVRTAALAALVALGPSSSRAAAPPSSVPRFDLPKSGLELARHTESGTFFDVVGRRSAVFGYENRALEAWVYPLKLIDDFRLSFQFEGYPLEIDGAQIATGIYVRPEATTFTYSHAAFTVRQTVFAPVDEPGIVMLLDVQSVLPLTVIGSFRPRLKLMWPAGLMTGNVGWDEKEQVYSLTEETKRFAAVIGTPGARDVSLMPYQEEPRDVPVRFVVELAPDAARTHLRSHRDRGQRGGRATRPRRPTTACSAPRAALYESNVAYYRALEQRTLTVETPDERLDTALRWAKVGVDKGLATNPLLGTGLVAGFRTSGESERPGFAWMFGRDALWTSLAIHSYGDFAAARTALEFLRKLQRDDGKIPHEISQSATLVPWFKDYEYPWDSADATPLYVVLQADHFRAHRRPRVPARELGLDRQGLALHRRHRHRRQRPHREHASSATAGRRAARPIRPTKRSTCRGSGSRPAAAWPSWRTSRPIRPWPRRRARPRRAHAGRGREDVLARRPRLLRLRHRARQAGEGLQGRAGPAARRRQARIDALRGHTIVDEDTVLPGVPLWWRVLDRRARGLRDRPSRLRRTWPRTGASASSRRRASCTTRSRITTARCGRCSRAGPRWAPTATAGPRSGTRR